jgi:hypothetical protein
MLPSWTFTLPITSTVGLSQVMPKGGEREREVRTNALKKRNSMGVCV